MAKTTVSKTVGQDACRLTIILILFWGLLWQSTAGAQRFVNDFEVCQTDSLAKGKFRDIIISDSGIVTTFFMAGADIADSIRIHRQFFQRFNADGRALGRAALIASSQTYSATDWMQVGANAVGKWVLVNHVINVATERTPVDTGLTVWVSSPDGVLVDSEYVPADAVQPMIYNHWACAGVDSAGGYAICWANNREPDGSAVWCRTFDAVTNSITDTIRISDTGGDGKHELRGHRNVRMTTRPDGKSVVVWEAGCDSCPPTLWSPQVFGRVIDMKGAELSPIFCASCDGDSTNFWNLGGTHPDVAMLPDGGFMMVWQQYRYDCGVKIMMRRFSADGLALSPIMIVDSSICRTESTPYCVTDRAGNLIVVWQDDEGDGKSLANVKAKRFDLAGRVVGEEFQINDGYKNVFFVSTPVAVNNYGLVGFLWGEVVFPSEGGRPRTREMMQLMDIGDVGIYVPGDANNDRVVDLKDVVFLLNFVLAEGPPPAGETCGDSNRDGSTNLADIVRSVFCLSQGGVAQAGCSQ